MTHNHKQVFFWTLVVIFLNQVFFLGVQISLAELQSLLSEMEGHNKAQAANLESLTATLNTKDDIINVIILPVTLATTHSGILNQKCDNLSSAEVII